jgi:hypothetical protein
MFSRLAKPIPEVSPLHFAASPTSIFNTMSYIHPPTGNVCGSLRQPKHWSFATTQIVVLKSPIYISIRSSTSIYLSSDDWASGGLRSGRSMTCTSHQRSFFPSHSFAHRSLARCAGVTTLAASSFVASTPICDDDRRVCLALLVARFSEGRARIEPIQRRWSGAGR